MTETELNFLAKKARISLEAFDKVSLLKELSEMQSFVENILSANIPPSTLPFENPLISKVKLRKDEIVPSLPLNLILKNAPTLEDSSIVVPKVL